MCEGIPILLFSWGSLAITSYSVPALLALVAYLFLFLSFSLVKKAFLPSDILFIFLFSVIGATFVYGYHSLLNIEELPGWLLMAPHVIFMLAYGVWRMAGRRPMTNMPWYRFGYIGTVSLAIIDAYMGFSLPVPSGEYWQFGGACLTDALVISPGFMVGTFWLLLDCRSPLVFCAKRCRNANKCLWASPHNQERISK